MPVTLRDARAIPEKALSVSRHGHLVLYTYRLWAQGLFDEYPQLKNLRGTIFDERTGEIVSLPFHKFFNLGERDMLSGERLWWAPKLDGYLVQLTCYDEQLVMASRTSLNPEGRVVRWARQVLDPLYYDLARQHPELTLLFELRVPGAPEITTPAREHRIDFLIARSKQPPYGYVLPEELGVPGVQWHPIDRSDLDAFIREVRSRQLDEGVVLFDGDDLLKVKTAWWFEATSVLKAGDPLKAYAAGMLDDFCALMALRNGAEDLKARFNRARSRLASVLHSELEKARQAPDRKTAALRLQQIARACPTLGGFVLSAVFAALDDPEVDMLHLLLELTARKMRFDELEQLLPQLEMATAA